MGAGQNNGDTGEVIRDSLPTSCARKVSYSSSEIRTFSTLFRGLIVELREKKGE